VISLTAAIPGEVRVSTRGLSQAAAQAPFVLATVTVSGSKRFMKEDVVRLSGLKIGESITTQALDGAASRLAGTGLFASVNYRYTTANGKLDVVFELPDQSWTDPVVFDNFVWFTDQELTAAVRQAVPSFDGTLPSNEEVVVFISQTLQRLLDARGIPAKVVGKSRLNIVTQRKQQLFRVTGTDTSLTMCSLRFEGTAGVPDTDLVKAAQSVIGTDYSRAFVDDLANGTLRQEYRHRGYWAAALTSKGAALDAGCRGVTVTLSVVEGAVYTWDHAQWLGVAALQAADLDSALGMKSGEVVDVIRLDAGLRSVHAAYDRRGYLRQGAVYTPVLDEASLRATFRIEVTEYEQFHMGTLTFPDLPEADAARLIKKWTIKAGDVFDGSYPSRFTSDEIRPLQNTGHLPKSLRPEMEIVPATRIVNVRFATK
jgi:outer membrane protein assembly factor BamA